jgi:hypothetical protein
MPSPSPDDPDPTVHSALINAKLVVVETVSANKKNKKALTKKVVKNKQYTHKFEDSIENYIELLNGFLKTHHKDKYQATVDHTFTFKIQVPPAKYAARSLYCLSLIVMSSFRVGEACDIEDYEEYKVVVASILERKPTTLCVRARQRRVRQSVGTETWIS